MTPRLAYITVLAIITQSAAARDGSHDDEDAMKPDIHPDYSEISITCSCGSSFTTRSTVGKDLHIEVCSQCHPFYTGQQKIVDTAGRVDKFRRKYGRG